MTTLNDCRPASTQIEDEPFITCAQCKRHTPVSECTTVTGCGDELFCENCARELTPSYGEEPEGRDDGDENDAFWREYNNRPENNGPIDYDISYYERRGYSEACGVWD